MKPFHSSRVSGHILHDGSRVWLPEAKTKGMLNQLLASHTSRSVVSGLVIGLCNHLDDKIHTLLLEGAHQHSVLQVAVCLYLLF